MTVHLYPISEEKQHDLECVSGECKCDPVIAWIDDHTGLPYENGPLVIHQELTKGCSIVQTSAFN